MADFSISDALGSGFGLMSRRPVSVVAWGLTYLVIGVALPLSIFGASIIPDYVGVMRSLYSGALTTPANFAQTMAPFHAKLMMAEPIMVVASLLAQAILSAAVFRATLEPRNRGLAYLRIGPRELWLLLVNFVMRVLAVVLAIALGLVGLGLGFALNGVFESQHVDWTLRGCSYVALGVLLFAIFIGICVRFSLAAPMTFADSGFRLFESWGLTRRHGWKLFALGLLLALVSAVMVLVFEAIVFAAVFLVANGFHWDATSFWGLLNDPQKIWSSGAGELTIAAALIGAYAFGAIFAVAMAPWAVAYRELLPKPAAPRAGGLFDPEPAPAPIPAPAPPVDAHAAHGSHGHGDDHGDAHGHADPHAPADDHGHSDDHGHTVDDGHGDDHGHGEAHARADDHGHDAHVPADDHGHAAPEAHADDHGHADAHAHDDHGHGEAHGHDDGHGHGDDHGHGGHGH